MASVWSILGGLGKAEEEAFEDLEDVTDDIKEEIRALRAENARLRSEVDRLEGGRRIEGWAHWMPGNPDGANNCRFTDGTHTIPATMESRPAILTIPESERLQGGEPE